MRPREDQPEPGDPVCLAGVGPQQPQSGRPPRGRALTDVAHEWVRGSLAPGEAAIDATAGNGHDTVRLAHAVGPTGRVFAFDIQAEALRNTAARLEAAGLHNATLLNIGHEAMARQLPADLHGRVGAVMFNLGYLPGGDKSILTRTPTTLAAIEAAVALLRPQGLLSVLAYVGHPGGREEAEAVERFLRFGDDLEAVMLPEQPARHPSPRLSVVRKRNPPE